MAATHVGALTTAQLIKQAGEVYKYSTDGGAEITSTYRCAWADVFNLIPKKYDAHPVFGSLQMENLEITREEGDIALIKALYVGLSFNGNGDAPAPVSELVVSTSQEPIETHPNFISLIGGKSGAELNNCQFDSTTGLFLGFPPQTSTGGVNEYAGIDHYLATTTIYRYSTVQSARPTSLKKVGKISKPPGAPAVDAGQNWLMISQTWTRRGGIYSVVTEWMLSGKRGWIANIYSNA